MPLHQLSSATKLLLAFLLVLAGALAYLLWQPYRTPAKETYHAVFLTSGDLYFGRLHTFPRLRLSDVYFLDRDQANPQAPYRLTKFSNAFWGPGDRLELNRENVVWINTLSDESPVAKAIQAARLGAVAPVPAPPSVLSQPATEPSSTSSPRSQPR